MIVAQQMHDTMDKQFPQFLVGRDLVSDSLIRGNLGSNNDFPKKWHAFHLQLPVGTSVA